MRKQFFVLIIFSFAINYIFGQTKQINDTDTSEIKIRGDYVTYIDGFRVYDHLSKEDSTRLLKDLVTKLNGSWISDSTKFVWKYKLSEKTFKGQLFNKKVRIAAPLLRLAIIKGQTKLITSTFRGIANDTSNIRIFNTELTIEKSTYHKQNK